MGATTFEYNHERSSVLSDKFRRYNLPQIDQFPDRFSLIFTGIAAVSIILTLISLIPVANARSAGTDRVFLILAWISFASSIIAFSFMFAMWSVAKKRFEKRGFGASYGPLVRFNHKSELF